MTIPGIEVLSARIILSEIGRDMNRFPSLVLGRVVSTHDEMPASAVPLR